MKIDKDVLKILNEEKVQPIDYNTEKQLMCKVQKLLLKYKNEFEKLGKNTATEIPAGPDTSKFRASVGNMYDLDYNYWMQDSYSSTHYCMILKVGSANLPLIGGLDKLKSIRDEIDNILKPYAEYVNWHYEGIYYAVPLQSGGRMYAKYDYATNWSSVGLVNTDHKFG